jgi:hypothetical protein
LRTNLTIRELAATFEISKSAAHRIVSTMVPRLAALAPDQLPSDRRASWVVDGTLIRPAIIDGPRGPRTTVGRATHRS